MEIKTLRYFLAVAREENMTRAAENLHVTQPTLSKQLKSLEDELGKKLFTRHSFSIKLTDEGVLLRDRAEDLVSMADKIEREFVSLDDITGGDLYFGLVFLPGRSAGLRRAIRDCSIISRAAIQSRSLRSWIKAFWISWSSVRSRIRLSMRQLCFRSRMSGAS